MSGEAAAVRLLGREAAGAAAQAGACRELRASAMDTDGKLDGITPEPAPQYPVPSDEEARMDLLCRLNVLGVRIEQFDPLVREAARLFAAPISAISLIDVKRQWFVAQTGLDVNETERSAAFCAHAIMPQAIIPFIVPDTHRDPRFRENPLVTGPPHIRFYCGMPVYVAGIKLGTLCVIDNRTRTFQRADFIRVVNAMGQLSRVVSRMLVRRGTTPHPAQANLVRAHPPRASDDEGRSQLAIGEHMVAALDVPLTSLDIGSPLYRALGLARGPRSGVHEQAHSWRSFDDAEFATLVGQLLELVDSSYVQVLAVGGTDCAEERSRVAEFRRQKGELMVAKFADMWDRLSPTDEGISTNRKEAHRMVSSPALFLQLAPTIAAWSRAKDETVASQMLHRAEDNDEACVDMKHD